MSRSCRAYVGEEDRDGECEWWNARGWGGKKKKGVCNRAWTKKVDGSLIGKAAIHESSREWWVHHSNAESYWNHGFQSWNLVEVVNVIERGYCDGQDERQCQAVSEWVWGFGIGSGRNCQTKQWNRGNNSYVKGVQNRDQESWSKGARRGAYKQLNIIGVAQAKNTSQTSDHEEWGSQLRWQRRCVPVWWLWREREIWSCAKLLMSVKTEYSGPPIVLSQAIGKHCFKEVFEM